MKHALRSEWLKITTVRSSQVMILLAFFSMPLIAVLVATFADAPLLEDVMGGRFLSTILVGCLAALVVGQEFRFGTIRTSLTATPRRGRLLAAKLLVLMALIVVMMVVGQALSLMIGLTSSFARDTWTTSGAQFWQGLAGSVLLSCAYALVGSALAVLFRTPIGAIVALLVWPLLGEILVGAIMSLIDDGLPDWLPFAGGSQWTSLQDAPDVRWFEGPLVLVGLTGALVIFAWLMFDKRDA
jgi:ABC-2 type transport system permease protein